MLAIREKAIDCSNSSWVTASWSTVPPSMTVWMALAIITGSITST